MASRFRDDGVNAEVRAAWTTVLSFAVPMVWNGVWAIVVACSDKPMAAPLGALGALVFGLLLVRALLRRVVLSFDGGIFRCRVLGPFPFAKPIAHPVSDVARFAYQTEAEGITAGHKFFLETRAGARIELPFDLGGPIFKLNGLGGGRHIGAATTEQVEAACVALDRLLESARRRGGSYRVAPGGPQAEVSEDEESHPGAERSRSGS